MLYYQQVFNNTNIRDTSKVAIEIFKEHNSSIFEVDQREYMVGKYLTPSAIKGALKKGRSYFLIFSNLTNVGYYSFEQHGSKIFLKDLCILKKHRLKGYGKGTIKKLSEECADYESIYTYVNKEDKETIAFFKHIGFKSTGDLKEDIGNSFNEEYKILELKIC